MRVGVTLLLGSILLTGCAVDREKAVQGKWATIPKDGAATALGVGIAAMTGNGATAERTLGKAMVKVTLDVRPDKTFTLAFDGAQREGVWTFDKQTGKLQLTIAKMAPVGNASSAQAVQPETWTSTLGKDNKRLNFFPGNAEVEAMIRKSDSPIAGGIDLAKEPGS